VLEQALKHVDGRPERRDGGPVLDLAVPAAIGELLAQEPLYERGHVHAEVGTRGNHVAVDARLDLTLEEPVVVPRRVHRCAALPDDMLADETDRPSGLLALGIEPEPPQQLQNVERVRPVLRPWPAAPPAVRRLKGQEPCAPSLGGDLRPFGGDDVRGLICEIPHGLPADRWVRVEQPVDYAHACPMPPSVAATPAAAILHGLHDMF
jgi:hypothetical protein